MRSPESSSNNEQTVLSDIAQLRWQTDVAELKKVYWEIARRRHPDMPGGSQSDFLAIKTAYEGRLKELQPKTKKQVESIRNPRQPRRDSHTTWSPESPPTRESILAAFAATIKAIETEFESKNQVIQKEYQDRLQNSESDFDRLYAERLRNLDLTASERMKNLRISEAERLRDMDLSQLRDD